MGFINEWLRISIYLFKNSNYYISFKMCTIGNIAGLITILIVPQQILLSNWGPNLERFDFLRHVLINRNCSLNFDIFFPEF